MYQRISIDVSNYRKLLKHYWEYIFCNFIQCSLIHHNFSLPGSFGKSRGKKTAFSGKMETSLSTAINFRASVNAPSPVLKISRVISLSVFPSHRPRIAQHSQTRSRDLTARQIVCLFILVPRAKTRASRPKVKRNRHVRETPFANFRSAPEARSREFRLKVAAINCGRKKSSFRFPWTTFHLIAIVRLDEIEWRCVIFNND